uniref:C-type lectin domain-containing protein n=1 Tax=Cryptomonas curvata TaxID=233186 RepID=A0A7S0M0N7_9CRYP
MTEVDARNGYAVFSDLIFKKAGSYTLRFISESSIFKIYSSMSNVFKVRPAETYILRITEQPAVFGKSGESLNAKVELLDIYDNTKSDDSNSIIISQIYSNQAEWIDCTKFTALNCGCIGNSASSILEFGTAEFRCLSVGQVGQNFTVSFQANGFQAFSRPFSVDPGALNQIRILQQPVQFKAGNISTPIVIEFQDKCGNSISDSVYDTFVAVDVVPTSAGLTGTSTVRSSSGQAIFADLSFTRANSDDFGQDVGYTLYFYIEDISIVSKPFWVTNAEIFAFQIVDQPKDILQGKSMKPFPKLVLTDTYGNVAVSSSIGGSSTVIVSLMQDNLQQNHSCSVSCDGSIVNGRCYKYFAVKSSWVDGESLCETWGGKLARIWSQEQIQFGTDLAGGAKAWIGLSYGQYGESYDWSWDENGERLDAQSQNWISRNLPVTPENTGLLNCIALGGQNNAWPFSATECSTLLPVICSKNSPVGFESSKTCYSCLPILGTNRIAPENGTAIFTNIQLFASPGMNYRLHFVLDRFRSTVIGKYLSVDQMDLNTEYSKSRAFSLLQGTEVSQTFEIYPRVSGMSIISQPGMCTNEQAFRNQPVLLLMDFLGRKVQIDGVHASVKLSASPQSATLGGNRSAVSVKGFIIFTDLAVLYPSPLQESFTLEFNAFDSSDSFTIFSSPFIVSPAAARLLLLHQGTCVGFTEYPCIIGAGDFIEAKIQMLDPFNEIVEHCSAVVVAGISGTSENALVGRRHVQCNKGVVSFTDLQIVKASDSASLLFSIKSLGISIQTIDFSVRQGSLANLVFIVQPSSEIAGNILPEFLVSATDLWGNIIVRPDIRVDIFVRLGDTCLTNVSFFKNSTTAGLAVFSNILLRTAGRFYFNARFSEECDPLKLLNPLPQYLYAIAVSSVFEIFPSFAAKISVLQAINEENEAGEAFSVQPSCIVRDRFGNNVSIQYKVKIRVIDRFGMGCVCNLSESGQLCSASIHPSVLFVEDNSILQEEDPSVSTVGGVAQFENLRCTRKSCAKSESPSPNCNSYKFSCEIVDAQFLQCLDCKAMGNDFHVRANAVNGLVVSKIGFAVSGRSWIPNDETAGFYDVLNDSTALNHAGLDETQRSLKPPSFFLVDRFGNVNESAHGLASVRISSGVKIAGYSFCADRSSKDGTLCLGGHTAVFIQNGTAVFTDLTILHSGPSFQLKFRFQNVEQDSALFNVLPSPPKASGVSIGADYSSLVIHFDRAVFIPSQELLNCSSIIYNATVLLGIAPRCRLVNSMSLQVDLGMSFLLKIGDSLTFKPNIPIFNTEFWDLNVNTKVYQQVSSPSMFSQNGFAINSSTVREVCLQLILPEQFQLKHELTIEQSVSVSDIEFFSIGGVDYCFVAYYCKGEFCLVDPSSTFSSKFALESPVYRWLEDDIEFVHGVPTQGAKDAKAFSLFDSGEIGPSSLLQFMVIANFRSEVAVWFWDVEASKFLLRQSIDSTFVTSIDVFTHDYSTLLVVANTDPNNALTVSRWISGEYNLDQNGTMSWIAGHFGSSIQIIPSNIVSRCLLYRIPNGAELFLGISSFQARGVGASNQVPLELMKWNSRGCNHSVGCFESLMSIPAVGASDFEPFFWSGTEFHQNFVAIANYFEGQNLSPVNSNYESLSYIYIVDYAVGTYSLLQTILTSGLWSILAFKLEDQLYLALGNQRGLAGLNVPVRVYKFTNQSNVCSSLRSTEPKIYFQHIADISARGPVALKYMLKGNRSWLIIAQGSGLIAASFFQIVSPNNAVPQPRPVISGPSVFGSCVSILLDARGSMNSIGSSFTVQWTLDSFVPAYSVADMIDSASLVVTNINSKLINSKPGSPYHGLLLAFPIPNASCTGAESKGICIDEFIFPDGQYYVSLHLTNWLGASNHAISTFVKAELTPRIFIHGPSLIETRRASQLLIVAEIEPYCPDTQLEALEIKWTISPDVNVIAGQGTIVVIPSFTLKVETVYVVNVSVRTTLGFPAEYSLKIVVNKRNPIASILGGDRLIGFADESVMVVNASTSYDPDQTDLNPHLAYFWICSQHRYVEDIDLGEYPFPCESISIYSNQTIESILQIDQQKLLMRMTSTSPIQNVPVFTTGCNSSEPRVFARVGLALCDSRSTYTFKVKVCINQSNLLICNGWRCCDSAEVVWSTTPASVPLVSVESLQENRISGSFDVAFRGSISSISPGQIITRWVQMIWNGIEYVPNGLDFEYVASDAISTNMILSAGYFKEARPYIFRLYATHSSISDLDHVSACSICGWAQVSVTVNSRPTNGRFDVLPKAGIAYQTLFELTAQEWYGPPLSDSVYPLYYTFGYQEANGAIQHIAIDSIQSSIKTLLPDGLYPCQSCAQSVSCACLPLILQVRDSLNAVGSPQLPFEVRIYQETGGRNISSSLTRLLEMLKSSVASRNSLKSLALISAQGVLLNYEDYNETEHTFAHNLKVESRNFIIQTLSNLLEDYNYMPPGTAAIFANALSLASRVSSELSPDSTLLARQTIDRLSSSIISTLHSGDKIVSLPDFILDAGSVLSSIVTYYSVLTKKISRRSGSIVDEINIMIESINNFAVLEAQGNSFIPGMLPKVQNLSKYVTNVFAVANSAFAGYRAYVEEGYPNLSTGEKSLARIVLPNSVYGLNEPFYALQLTMLYENPFPYDLKCLDYNRGSQFETPKVFVPTDNAGSVQLTAVRKPLTIFGQRTCALLGNIVLANVRIGQSSQALSWQSAMKMRVMLPFDPAISPSAVSSDTSDGLTGSKLGASCVRWNPIVGTWTAAGIRRVSIFLGNSSVGPYIECEVDSTGIFVASEVPLGCDGIPLSTAVNDDCGVCGGNNEICSGCDGLPNSGRSKSCSGHGACFGQICKCALGYLGVICQIMCEPITNCSGHGVCEVSYRNLDIVSNVSCLCQDGFISSRKENSTLKVGCEPEIVSNELVPRWAVIAMSVVASGLVLIAVSTFLLRIVYKQKLSLEAMKKDVAIADGQCTVGSLPSSSAIEVQADLAYPLYPMMQDRRKSEFHDQQQPYGLDQRVGYIPSVGTVGNEASGTISALNAGPDTPILDRERLYSQDTSEGEDEAGVPNVNWRLALLQDRIVNQKTAKLCSAVGPSYSNGSAVDK